MTLADFYKTVWKGGFDGEDSELEILLSRAADIVDGEIFLSGKTVETAPEYMQTAVYKAVCAQADYIDSQGGIDHMNESSGGSVSLGKFSYSDEVSRSQAAADMPCELCRQARNYLLPTGLLYKGVKTV